MGPVEFVKSRPVSLKASAIYNEKWLQSLIAGDPNVLGLGDLIVKDVERRQPRAGGSTCCQRSRDADSVRS